MFNRMRIYTVHLQPETPLSTQKPLFIKEGMNFPAFLIPLFWALYQRLWLTAILLMGFEVSLMFIARAGLLGAAGVIVLDIGMHFWVGFAANDWLRSNLSKRGYLFSDVAVADSKLRAEQRYFDRCFAAAA